MHAEQLAQSTQRAGEHTTRRTAYHMWYEAYHMWYGAAKNWPGPYQAGQFSQISLNFLDFRGDGRAQTRTRAFGMSNGSFLTRLPTRSARARSSGGDQSSVPHVARATNNRLRYHKWYETYHMWYGALPGV